MRDAGFGQRLVVAGTARREVTTDVPTPRLRRGRQVNNRSAALAGRRQGLGLCAGAFQQAEEIAVGGENVRCVFGELLAIGLHALEEIVEFGGLRILGISLGINLGRFSIGFAADLLHLAVGGGLNFIYVAFLSAGDAGRKERDINEIQ